MGCCWLITPEQKAELEQKIKTMVMELRKKSELPSGPYHDPVLAEAVRREAKRRHRIMLEKRRKESAEFAAKYRRKLF